VWAKPETIEFTDYAVMRMSQRDILESEVVEALNCPCNHHERDDGRSEVRHPSGPKTLLVVYRRGQRARYVINAMWI
jgi:hypothetical protein